MWWWTGELEHWGLTLSIKPSVMVWFPLEFVQLSEQDRVSKTSIYKTKKKKAQCHNKCQHTVGETGKCLRKHCVSISTTKNATIAGLKFFLKKEPVCVGKCQIFSSKCQHQPQIFPLSSRQLRTETHPNWFFFFFCKIWKTKFVDLSLQCLSCHFNHPLAFPWNCFCKAGSFCQYKPSFLLSTQVRSPRSEDVTAAPALVPTSKCGFLWCCGLFEFAQEGGRVGSTWTTSPFYCEANLQLVKAADLSLWLRAFHPDSRRNLFTASFLHFSIAALRVFQKVNTMFQ